MILVKCMWMAGMLMLFCGGACSCVYAATDAARDTAVVSIAAAAPADSTGQFHVISPSAVSDTMSIAAEPHFFRRLGDAFVTQASAPFRMNAAQAAYVGAGIGITLGFVALDEEIDRGIRRLDLDHTAAGKASSSFTDFGGTNGIAAVMVYSGYSVIWDDAWAQETSMLLAEAIITSGVWTRLGKLVTGRERPSAAYEYSHLPGGRWHGLGGSLRKHSGETVTKYDAFPSGHTATAFAIATVFAKRYSKSSYVPILSYSLATIIGFTRMVEHTHWASDVFAGACIGYLCAGQVVAQYEREQAGATAAGVRTTVRFSLGMLNESPALQLAVGF